MLSSYFTFLSQLMLTGVFPVRSIKAAKRGTKTYSHRHPFRLVLLSLMIMLVALSSRCRASFLRYQRSAAFLTNADTTKRSEISGRTSNRVSLFTSLTQLESHDDMEQPSNAPRRRKSLSPPRARPMPPTLESNDSTSISPVFPDFDANLEFDEYVYDPSINNEVSYGFFTDLDETPEPISSPGTASSVEVNSGATTLADSTMDTDTLEWDESDDENDDIENYPMEDAHMHSLEGEDVPNPHNYWEDDDKSAVVDDLPLLNANASEATVQAPTATDKTSINASKKDNMATPSPSPSMPPRAVIKASKKHNTAMKKDNTAMPPPSSSMPPRAVFASQPPNTRQDVYIQASSGDAITSQVDMLTAQLHQLEKKIYAQNNNKEFNINSPKQVAQVLFGKPGQSTNKETLGSHGWSWQCHGRP